MLVNFWHIMVYLWLCPKDYKLASSTIKKIHNLCEYSSLFIIHINKIDFGYLNIKNDVMYHMVPIMAHRRTAHAQFQNQAGHP